MQVAVTGAGGMIGGFLVGRLIADGHDVLAVDIKPLEEWWQRHPDSVRLAGRYGDMSNPKVAFEVMRGTDRAYCLAALMGGIGFIEGNRADCMLRSTLITATTLDAAVDAAVERVFVSSSACVYPSFRQDDPDVTPLRERDAWPADPEEGYGTEKLAAEELFRLAGEDFPIETRIGRYHNIYSGHSLTWEGGKEKAPAALCRKVAEAVVSGRHEIEIWGDGSQTRSFCWIDDCVEGTIRLTDSDYGGPLNIGSEELVTINELVTIIEEIAGVTLDRKYDTSAAQGVRGRSSDNALIRSTLGWEPSTPLREGLAHLYPWVLAQVERRARE